MAYGFTGGLLIPQRAARPHHGGLKRPSATVNGYSLELPFMQGVKRWAVLTIGTGLGNASHVNTGVRPKPRRR